MKYQAEIVCQHGDGQHHYTFNICGNSCIGLKRNATKYANAIGKTHTTPIHITIKRVYPSGNTIPVAFKRIGGKWFSPYGI